ncbi:MAG: excisionase family DNA-binding protein, partial [Thermoguttaceae bacterium]|nr:excisionase family DNA-binding protein [Thermoguttaceae bacterium]
SWRHEMNNGHNTVGSDALALSLKEAAKVLSISERHLRSLVAKKLIPVVRLGRRVVVPRSLLAAALERLATPTQRPRSSSESQVKRRN